MSSWCPIRHSATPVRDGPWAWLVLLYSLVLTVMTGGMGFMPSIQFPLLMKEFDENREKTALIGSLTMGLGLFFCVIASDICNRYNSRLTNAFALLCMTVSLVLSSLAHNVYQLYITYSCLIGIGMACHYTTSFRAIRYYFDKYYSLATGICVAGEGIGVLATAPLILFLFEKVGWRNTYRIFSGFLVFLLFFDFIHDSHVVNEKVNHAQKSSNDDDTDKDNSSFGSRQNGKQSDSPGVFRSGDNNINALNTNEEDIKITHSDLNVTDFEKGEDTNCNVITKKQHKQSEPGNATANGNRNKSDFATRDSEAADKMRNGRKRKRSRLLDLSIWSFPEYSASVVSMFIVYLGHYTPSIHLVKFSEEQGLSTSEITMLILIYGITNIISRVVIGRLCDISFIKARHVNQAATMLSGTSTLLLTMVTSPMYLSVLVGAYGLSDGAFRVTLNILFMNTVDPPRRASAFGQANMVTALPCIAGPAITGFVADKLGSYVPAFYLAGVCSIVGSAILFINTCFDNHNKERARKEIILDQELAERATNTGTTCQEGRKHSVANTEPMMDQELVERATNTGPTCQEGRKHSVTNTAPMMDQELTEGANNSSLVVVERRVFSMSPICAGSVSGEIGYVGEGSTYAGPKCENEITPHRESAHGTTCDTGNLNSAFE